MQANQQFYSEDIFKKFFEYCVELAEHIPHKFLIPQTPVNIHVPRWINTTFEKIVGETKRTSKHHMVR